ncbi:MAG: DUF3575 domain-containing protein [Ignavibacteriales bacterium]|nr:DUF3575 domain-containing protein [Ignavibacteriales bacterium]
MKFLRSFSILFILLSVYFYAQTPVSKGVYSLSGSLSYSSISVQWQSYEDTETRFNLNPGADYFIIANLSLGLSINYNRSSFNDFWEYSIGAGPAIKYYFSVEKVIPFVGAFYNYTAINKANSYRYGPDVERKVYKVHTNVFSFFAGIEYFLGRNVALEPKVTYTIYKEKEDAGTYYPLVTTTKIFAVGIGISVFIY